MTENNAIEAVMVAFSKVKEGTKLVLVLHPDDVPTWLQLAPLGQRIAFAAVPIKDETSEYGQGAKVPYSEWPASRQAGLRCKDAEFQRWALGVAEPYLSNEQNEKIAANWVREKCGIESRSELDTNGYASEKWEAIDAQFCQDTGRMAEQR